MDWINVCEAVIAVVIVGTPAFVYRWCRYKKQEATLHGLAELRTAGVELRNKSRGEIFTDEEFDEWNSEIEKWKMNLYRSAKEFSPVVSERLKTLDLWEPEGYTGPETDKQKEVIAYTTETLKRVDRILEKRFRPTHAP